MHFEGRTEIAAPRERVWAFVMDPRQVAGCGPGVESVEVIDDSHFRIRVSVGIAFIKARFTIDTELFDVAPMDTANLRGRGQAPGSTVEFVARMSLEDGPRGSIVMDWSSDVTLTGKLASVGARLIEGMARKLIGQTFECMKRQLESPAA
ncbi:MAG: carbon monoxide dehydrogenase subunit G [Chloroflexota bacterium]|nr:carbon monoxide dehydrogenase subunit G [Chloroflexota bacterium]